MGRIKGICKIEGCERQQKSHGLRKGKKFYLGICSVHYKKKRRKNDLAKDEGAEEK